MPLRALPAAILLGLVALPLAAAQGPATASPTVTLSLPSSYSTNDTIAVVPFDVGLSTGTFACLGSSAQFTVALEATASPAGNATNGTPSAMVQPSELTFTFSPAQGAQGASDSQGAVATVSPANAGFGENETLTVTATVTDLNGCTGTTLNGGTATGSTAVTFEAPAFAGAGDEDEGQAMPGLGLLALLAALGVAMLARRPE